MNKELRDYIDLKYGEQLRSNMTLEQVKMVEDSYGYAGYKMNLATSELVREIKKELSPFLLFLSKFIVRLAEFFNKK